MCDRYNWYDESESTQQVDVEFFNKNLYEGHFNWWCNESENVELIV